VGALPRLRLFSRDGRDLEANIFQLCDRIEEQMERIATLETIVVVGGPGPIANMNFNDLIPTYENGTLVGWTCSRCAWSNKRDIHLADIDALAVARAEFFNHPV
jgi:hypothetical protein